MKATVTKKNKNKTGPENNSMEEPVVHADLPASGSDGKKQEQEKMEKPGWESSDSDGETRPPVPEPAHPVVIKIEKVEETEVGNKRKLDDVNKESPIQVTSGSSKPPNVVCKKVVIRSIRQASNGELVAFVIFGGYDFKNFLDRLLPTSGYVAIDKLQDVLDHQEKEEYVRFSNAPVKAKSLAPFVLLSDREVREFGMIAQKGFQLITKVGASGTYIGNSSSKPIEKTQAEFTKELENAMKNVLTHLKKTEADTEKTPILLSRVDGTKSYLARYNIKTQRRDIPDELVAMFSTAMSFARINSQFSVEGNQEL